jgi:hypothetical protein
MENDQQGKRIEEEEEEEKEGRGPFFNLPFDEIP